MPNTPPSTMASGSPDSAWKLADFIQQMWLSGDLFDVHFTVGREFGQTRDFAAHKFVLAARSSVLRAMFYGSLSEKCETALDIPDIHPEAFGNLLSFAYADTVENLTDDNVLATMRCADKYYMPQLMAVCSEFLVSHLNLENCLAFLDEAIQWHAEGVVRQCLELVDVKSYEIFQSQQFTAISPEALQMILQRSTLIVNEFVLYLATEKWAAATCARNNMDPSGANLRRMLGDAVFLIRFPLLTRTQLAGGPALRGLLSESEISSIIMYHREAVPPVFRGTACGTPPGTGSADDPVWGQCFHPHRRRRRLGAR
ncbi:BTB/POZ domain-containing protein 6-B-like [Paramacrobiotus metropolitanus]|uniref:BTB/POZ domain-containing protein 6-B-like n=1 Tax=Paramacrobiotus metropolitanus TaxID=2943436 RepID=UPI00244621F7|nr:BTB/POZ domain-containing protein 6-B-like [Paramacrobiotus metropolitanus]